MNLLLHWTEAGTTVSDGEGIYEFVGCGEGATHRGTEYIAMGVQAQRILSWVLVARFFNNNMLRDAAFQKKPGIPSVSITTIPEEIFSRESANLLWTSENADTAYIDQALGRLR